MTVGDGSFDHLIEDYRELADHLHDLASKHDALQAQSDLWRRERDRARDVAVALEGTMAQARGLLLVALEDPREDAWRLPPEARRDLVEEAASLLDFEPLVDVATGEPV